MSKFKYFELTEFLKSNKARELKIDNSPTFEIVEHIEEFVSKFLEPLRSAYGKPITISSGYRSNALNQAVGGVLTSAHKFGYAADLQVNDIVGLFNFICEWVKHNGIMFDQIFIESKKDVRWIHVGFKNRYGQQRRMIGSIDE